MTDREEQTGRYDDPYLEEEAPDPESDRQARAEALREADREREREESRRKRLWRQEARRRRFRGFLETHRRGLAITGILLFILAALVLVAHSVISAHHITNVTVEGNTLHTDEEIIGEVCSGPFGMNSLYLARKYDGDEETTIPFVEKVDVQIVEADTIHITVYEKALAGYVTYLGYRMYFDRDGTVVEASEERIAGVPEVSGLRFDRVILGEKLPVKNPAIFDEILDVTQRLRKYALDADRIYFDDNGDLTVFCGQVRALLGQGYLDEKIARLAGALPRMEDPKGVIDMTSFSPNNTEFYLVDWERRFTRPPDEETIENVTGGEEAPDRQENEAAGAGQD